MEQQQTNKNYGTSEIIAKYYSDTNLIQLSINTNRKFLISFINRKNVDGRIMFDSQNAHLVSMDWEDFSRLAIGVCNLVNIEAARARGMSVPDCNGICIPLVAKTTMQQYGAIKVEKQENGGFRLSASIMKDGVVTESKFNFRPTDTETESIKFCKNGEVVNNLGLQNLLFYDFARTLKNACEYGQFNLALHTGIKYSGGNSSYSSGRSSYQRPQGNYNNYESNRQNNQDSENSSSSDWNNDDIPF